MFQDVYAHFQVEVLDNGLSVYFKQWPVPVSWMYAGMIIHAGAREDPPGREGLAHLVEHVVGENIDGLTFSQLNKRVEALGGWGSFGTTSYLASKYTFHVPSVQKSIHEAFSLFGHMLLQGKLIRRIEEEKLVILREYDRKYGHQEGRKWSLRGRPYLFEQHPRLHSYASAIGIPDEFLLSTQEEIQQFYDTYYTPRNMSLVCIVNSEISKRTLLALLQETPFAMQKPGQRTSIPPAFTPGLPKKQEQFLHLCEFSQVATSAACTFEWVLPLRFTKTCVQILEDMLEEALMEELRYKQSLTYEVSVGSEYYQDCRVLSIHFEIPPTAVETAKEVLWRVLRSVPHAQEPFLAAKRERINCIYRMDYNGNDLLETVIGDLEDYHRLIPFTEELRMLECTQFSDVVDLADYLTPERQFCYILLP